MNNAEVLIKFKGDTASANQSIDGLKSKIGGLASGIAKGIGTATAIATTAIAGMSKKAIDSFADFEQLSGGLEAMFENDAKGIERVTKTSEQAYKDLQMSQNDYLRSFESSYAIIKNGISENADAIEYTNKTLQLTADLYNTYGGSTEQYATAINWALKGTFSYVDNLNLGIKGTQEGFVEAANKAGILNREIKSVKELTNDEIIDVIQHYAKETGAWGRSTEEAKKTIQGSLNMTKASFQDFLTSLAKGDNIDTALDNLVESAIAFGDNILPVIEKVINSIASALPKIIDKVIAILPGLIQKTLPSLIKGAVALVNGLIQALPILIQTLLPHLITGIFEIGNQILLMLPEIILMIAEMLPTLIPTIIDAILTTIPMLLDHLPEFINAGFQLLVGIVSGLISALPKVLQFGIKFVGSLLSGIVSTIGKIPEAIFGVFNKVGTGLGNIADGIKNVFKRTFEAIANIVKTPINWLIGGLNTFIRAINKIKIPDWVPVVGGLGFHIPEIPKLATGTNYVPEDTLAMIHKGEAVVPKKFNPYANGINTQTMGAMQNSDKKQIINVYVESNTDPLGQVVSQIKTFGGGAKNDYNYGYGGM